MNSRVALPLTLFLLIVSSPTFAQVDRLNECPRNFPRFVLFEKDLKAALSKPDPSALMLLVQYPLRINQDNSGSILLNNAAALLARFQEVFPESVRNVVINETRPIFERCGGVGRGLMCGAGAVWVNVVGEGEASRYAVTAVNLPHETVQSERGLKVEFICHANQQRILIESDAKGSLRYRAWNNQRSVADQPDLLIESGTKHYEGSGICVHPLWDFKSGDLFISVSEGGCNGGSPLGSLGWLATTRGSGQPMYSSCF